MSNKNKKDIELIVSFCSCGSGKKYGQCCYSNSPINIKRDAAISFSMPEGGAIKGVIDAGGYLCTVGEDAIYKITLADVIDPDRTNIKTKSTTTQTLNIGMNDFLVSRIIGQLQSLPTTFVGEEDLKVMNEVCLEILIKMKSIRDTIIDIQNEFAEKEDSFNKENTQTQNKDSINDIRQIGNLTTRVTGFFTEGNKILKDILKILNLIFDADERGKNFTQIKEIHDKGNEFQDEFISEILGHHMESIDFIWNIRNSIEHNNEGKLLFRVTNISTDIDNKLTPPTIRYVYKPWSSDYKESEGEEPLLNLMCYQFQILLAIVEDIIAHVVCFKIEKFGSPLPYTVTLDDSPGAAFRYTVEWQLPSSQSKI